MRKIYCFLFTLLLATPVFADSSATSINSTTAGAQSIVSGINPTATSGSMSVVSGVNPSATVSGTTAEVGNVSAGIGDVEANVTLNSEGTKIPRDFPNTVQVPSVNMGFGVFNGPYKEGWNTITKPWLLKSSFSIADLERFTDKNGGPKGEIEINLLTDAPRKLKKGATVEVISSKMDLEEIKKSFDIVATIDVYVDNEKDVSYSHLFYKALEANIEEVGATYMIMVAYGAKMGSQVSGWNIGFGGSISMAEKTTPGAVAGSISPGVGIGSIKAGSNTYTNLSLWCLIPK